ncbi:hypothetical protein [Streptomyces sp. NBC_01435]|uniref:hypothetical protein n=1 Tax=Streptomyces sp. NBC_01435 TaxID=2903865 RepID=UPI002E3736F6|nr:hypothetical protein [Streptomyces sp. NBC_01435]
MTENVVHVPGDPFPFLVHGRPPDLLARGPQVTDREVGREDGAECRGHADESSAIGKKRARTRAEAARLAENNGWL